MMNIFTKREKIYLAVFGVIFLLIMIFHIELLVSEYFFYFFVVIPLGVLIATDKERLDRLKKK